MWHVNRRFTTKMPLWGAVASSCFCGSSLSLQLPGGIVPSLQVNLPFLFFSGRVCVTGWGVRGIVGSCWKAWSVFAFLVNHKRESFLYSTITKRRTYRDFLQKLCHAWPWNSRTQSHPKNSGLQSNRKWKAIRLRLVCLLPWKAEPVSLRSCYECT